jgi:hypothetical protein
VASHDEAIPPGGEGKITLSVNTKGYQGEHSWETSVNTNDPVMDFFHLSLKAFINVPVLLSSRHVYLAAPEGKEVTRGVEIRAGLERPLALVPERFDLEGKASYSIEEIEKGKFFRVLFRNVPAFREKYQGILVLRTNYPENPELTIRVMGVALGKSDVSPHPPGEVR